MNLNQANSIKQKSSQAGTEDTLKNELAEALNRNVFNNKRRMVNNLMFKSQIEQQKLGQSIIEEEKDESIHDSMQNNQSIEVYEIDLPKSLVKQQKMQTYGNHRFEHSQYQ